MTLSALLRISLLAQLVAGTLAARWVLPDSAGWGGALLAGALLPVAGTAVVLALELAVAAVIDPRQPRIWPLQWLGVWLGETSCSVRAFAWRQPFAAGFAEPPLVHDPQRPAVLLIHGYVCNRAVWKPLLDSGRLADCNVATINLQPVFGSIDRYAEEIHAAVERLRAATGAARVVLVGHSMGGLAARAYLRRHGDAAVARVVTLASPHHGTVFAALGHGANARQMRKDSAYLTTLAGAESAALRRKFVCIASADDNLVIPRTSPLLPGADSHVLDGVGHLALTEDGRVWERVRAAVLGARDVESALTPTLSR